jgi:hypothetical protein
VDREQQQATLILLGWCAIERHHGALATWGISHNVLGSIHEDAWHKEHGPSLAPLKRTTWVIHRMEPGFERLWAAVTEGGWGEP